MSNAANNIIEQLMDMWRTDAAWDKTEPQAAMQNIPRLHAKYLNILTTYNQLGKRAEIEYRLMKRWKMDYYAGRMSQQELQDRGLTQFKFILKHEADEYVGCDSDLLKIKDKLNLYGEMVDCAERILKELNNRTFQIKEFMSWEKFLNGV